MNALPPGSPVVIYVNGSSCGDPVTISAVEATGPTSAPPVGYDAYQVHREFRERWCAYITGNYRTIAHVARVFQVSERTARNWWNGQFGPNGGYVAVAMREHGDRAFQMLFGEAG